MHQSDGDKMSAFDEAVAHDLSLLEEIKLRQHGTRRRARAVIARETKVSPGTFFNIRQKRSKGIRGWVGHVVKALLLKELEGELKRLSHERDLILQCGVDPRSDEMSAVVADLAKVRTVMEGMR